MTVPPLFCADREAIRVKDLRVAEWAGLAQPAVIGFCVTAKGKLGWGETDFEMAIGALKKIVPSNQRSYDHETHRWTVRVTDEIVADLSDLFANFAGEYQAQSSQLTLF